jgi:hypothetical protein
VGSCNNFNCFFEFPVVPEGMRLEILHVSGIARPSAAATIVDQAELITDHTENEQLGARNSFDMALIGEAGVNVIGQHLRIQPACSCARACQPRSAARDEHARRRGHSVLAGDDFEIPRRSAIGV